MATVESILELLRKWDPWKRIVETPDRVDDLEERVAELEGRLERAPGEACPSCGAYEYRVAESKKDSRWGGMGGIRRLMRCEECGFEESRLITPGES